VVFNQVVRKFGVGTADRPDRLQYYLLFLAKAGHEIGVIDKSMHHTI